MTFIRMAALSLSLLLARAGFAADLAPPPVAPGAAATAPEAVPPAAADAIPKATEDAIRERILKRVPGKLMSLKPTGFGLYEAVIDSEIVYVDEAVNYVFAGHVYDTRTHQDLTAKRSEEVLRVDFAALPLQLAFKVVRGDGSRPVAIFEDPNCPYCKNLERGIRMLQNTTMYIFLYPILSDDSVAKSTQVWCSKDPAGAWARLMLNGQLPEKAPDACKTPIDDVLELGHRLNVTGTPTLIFADGRRAPGVIPLERVEQMLDAAARPQPPR